MQSVGTRLREARIKTGYTLEEINARTRISLKNLAAIESDDLPKISSPFTYRSFVKQVADIVGLDHATLAADVQTASSTMPEPLVPGQEEETFVRPHQFQQQPRPKDNRNWLRIASIAGLAGVVSVYLIWRKGGLTDGKLQVNNFPASSRIVAPKEAKTGATPAPVPPPQPAAAESATAKLVADRPPEAAQTDSITPPPPPGTEQLLSPGQISGPAEGLDKTATAANSAGPMQQAGDSDGATIHIELSAIQPTWLSISADGKNTYSGTLAAMKTMSFDGKESAQIRTANAGGVNIIFNGHALGSLGGHGQARTFVFTKGGYEVVQGAGGLTLPRALHTGG